MLCLYEQHNQPLERVIADQLFAREFLHRPHDGFHLRVSPEMLDVGVGLDQIRLQAMHGIWDLWEDCTHSGPLRRLPTHPDTLSGVNECIEKPRLRLPKPRATQTAIARVSTGIPAFTHHIAYAAQRLLRLVLRSESPV